MRKKKQKEKISEDTMYSLLIACMLIYGVMVLVYYLYNINTV